MIAEIDEAVRTLVLNDALRGTDVEVVFDAPTRDWAARRNAPTINVYLYDIREDMRKRTRGRLNSYDDAGRVVARHLPPRHYRLSYLVTAWTQRPEDEHRLLSALLGCFVRHEAMPADLLAGELRELGLPVGVSVALPPPEDRSFADVWSALGGELKPSLDLVISAPIDIGRSYDAAPAVTEPPVVDMHDTRPDTGGGIRRDRRTGRAALPPPAHPPAQRPATPPAEAAKPRRSR